MNVANVLKCAASFNLMSYILGLLLFRIVWAAKWNGGRFAAETHSGSV